MCDRLWHDADRERSYYGYYGLVRHTSSALTLQAIA